MRLRAVERLVVLGCCGFVLTAGRPAFGQAGAGLEPISITVSEYDRVPRDQEPVTGGIPITPDLAGAQWALFDGEREIPLQTTVLPHRTTPWLLLDFQITLGVEETRALTLRPQAPTAAPAHPLVIAEDAGTITVTTGPIRTKVGKATFNLLDRVWFDRNGNGAFASDEQVVGPNSAANLVVHEVERGDCPGRGTPARLEWEYRGPLRATLRVDGTYRDGASSVLDYTTRMTWYAGQTHVRIDHVLRNSHAPQQRHVKLSSARLNVGSGPAIRIPRSGHTVWSGGAQGAVLELIPTMFTVSSAYDPEATPPVPRHNATIVTVVNGGLVIGDMSHHGSTWFVDFANRSPVENGRRATAAADPLVVLADPARYSKLDAFGLHQFGTYEDEKESYRRWGWAWPVPGNPRSHEHDRPRVQDIYPSLWVLDASQDPESDDLWQNIVMFARVQIPFYLDRLRAWARYLRWEWAFRTDGFDYAGSWGTYSDGPGADTREPVLQPPLTVVDDAYIRNNIQRAKPGSSHMWNGGLLDAYYLTGDRDALEAAIDVAEQCALMLGWRNAETQGVGGNCRFEGRCLLVLTRTWEATDDPRWRAAADHAVDLFLRSRTYDPRGFFYVPIGNLPPAVASRFSPDAKLVTPFMMTTVVEGLYRYHLATGDPATRRLLLQIGAFARDHGLDPPTGYGGDEIVVDSPGQGDVMHLSESQWRNQPPIVPYAAASSSACFVNALVIRYRLTGDPSYLERAKLMWDRASKRHYVDPYDRTFAGPNEVGRFANSMQAWDPNGLTFPEAGDWTAVSLLFREAAHADTTPPARILDLTRPTPGPRPATPSRSTPRPRR